MKDCKGCNLYFAGRLGNDAKRVNTAVHQVAGGVLNQAMAGQAAETGKAGGADDDLEVGAAGRAGVTGMTGGVVDDLQLLRQQGGLQPRLQEGRGVRAHAGKTLRKGLTVTRA